MAARRRVRVGRASWSDWSLSSVSSAPRPPARPRRRGAGCSSSRCPRPSGPTSTTPPRRTSIDCSRSRPSVPWSPTASTGRRRSPSGYVTLGAGARAVGNSSTGGQGFGVDEPFGRDPAGDVFTTRTGIPAGNGLVYMPITETIDSNDSELYGAKVGLLGDELAQRRHRPRCRRQRRRDRPEHARDAFLALAARRGGGADDQRRQGAGREGRPDAVAARRRGTVRCPARPRPRGARVRRRVDRPVRWCWSRAPTSCAPTSRRASHPTSRRSGSAPTRWRRPTASSGGCSSTPTAPTW